LDDMQLRQVTPLDAPWADVLATAGDHPLVLAGEVDGRRIAILPFALGDSDLPLRVAWPVLMANLLEWMAPARLVDGPAAATVGDPLPLRWPPAVDAIRITHPDGTVQTTTAADGLAAYTGVDRPGHYRIEALAGDTVLASEFIAANLFGTGESDIAPRAPGELALGGTARPAASEQPMANREFWPLLALAALLILLVEWAVYQRRMQVPTLLGRARPQRGRP
jgi:Ca-activated chloride channel homolog